MTPLGLPETLWRLVAFAAIFATMAALELTAPRLERPEMARALKSRRWITNLAMVVLSSLLLRLIFPMAAVGAALIAASRDIGVFPALGIAPWAAGLLSFVILDFSMWLQHLIFHKVPILWRIHRMHHADTGFDVTTGLRFHPLEILISILLKAGIVIALGAPPWAVLIFEIVLNGAAMFNHANIRLPGRIEPWLRHVIVTPDMHRIHHSTERGETDSNYGFNFPIWDRLFSTYTAMPARGQEDIELGLPQHRGDAPAGLLWSLLLPFRRD